MQLEQLFLAPLIFAGFISYSITNFVIKIAWKLNLIDDPSSNSHPKVIHNVPTPRAGGLGIFIAIFAASIFFLPLDQHLFAILLGASLVTLIGLLDDKYDISPYTRLIMQFIAASIPIASGIGIAFITNPIAGGIIDLSHPRLDFFLLGEHRSIWLLSDLFALFWIVTLMNFLNMGAKGVDGQLSGVVPIAAITIALLSLQFSADITEWQVIILASIVAGSYLGFLPWHIFPQKIMPSFSGSNLGGYMLAVLSILTTAKVGTLVVVLGVPIVDTGYLVIKRILSGKSPVWGDRGHLHHKLLDAGLSKHQVATVYWALTAFLGILVLNLNAQTKLYTIGGIAFLLLGLTLWLTYRPKRLRA